MENPPGMGLEQGGRSPSPEVFQKSFSVSRNTTRSCTNAPARPRLRSGQPYSCKYRNQFAREATCPALPCATSTTARGLSAGQYHPCSFVPSSAVKKTSWNCRPAGSQSPFGNFDGKKSSSSSIDGAFASLAGSDSVDSCAKHRSARAPARRARTRGTIVRCITKRFPIWTNEGRKSWFWRASDKYHAFAC